MGTEVTKANFKLKFGFEVNFPEQPYPSLLRPACCKQMQGRHLVAFSLQTRPDPAQLDKDRQRQSWMNGTAEPRQTHEA